MATTVVNVTIADGTIVVNPSQTTVIRGDVINWTTDLREGVTIIPLQGGLTILKRSAEPGAPAVALATNTGYYNYDVYWPSLENLLGQTQKTGQRVTAVLIVAEYKQQQPPASS